MRKITYDAARAFIEGQNFCRGNTSVNLIRGLRGLRSPDRQLHLHGNMIADYWYGIENKGLYITLAGWPTVTARERINGLLTELGRPEGVWQRNHEQYYGTLKHNRTIDSYELIKVPTNGMLDKLFNPGVIL